MNRTSRDTRSWTDDQLCVTVAEQVSWRRVALALGLASSAGWRLKRYAERLGLDASHFLEEQGWSEPDLRAAVAVSSSWPDAMRRLGVDDTYELRLRVKGQAVRIGLDVSRLAAHQAPELPALETLAASPDLTHLRRAAELIAVAWFSMRNIPVATPTDPCAYDLLVTLGCGVRRVQVKSSASRGRQGTWKVQVGRRPYVLDKSAQKIPYDPDELDYFFVVDGDGALYFLPIGVVAGMTQINIGRYAGYRIGDASSLFTAAV